MVKVKIAGKVRNGKKGGNGKKKNESVGTQQRVASGFGGQKTSKGARGMAGLDDVAKCHARMLLDPCRAQLGPSVYPGSNGAITARFEQDTVLFNAASTGASALVWSPGLASFVTSPAVLLNDTTTFNFSALQPAAGNAFLVNQAGWRCVGACMQVYYPGAENTRQGFVGMGYGPGSMLTQFQLAADGGVGTQTTVQGVRTSQFHTERVPNTMIELKWKPGFGDQEWEGFNTAVQQVNTNNATNVGRNCITLTASGLPASTGLRVRFVAIYEYMPAFNSGLISTVSNAVITKNTLNDVLHTLDKTGNWFLGMAEKYGPTIGYAINYASTLLV